MTVRLVLALIVGTCGGYLLIVAPRTQISVAAGIGLLVACFALIVDHRY